MAAQRGAGQERLDLLPGRGPMLVAHGRFDCRHGPAKGTVILIQEYGGCPLRAGLGQGHLGGRGNGVGLLARNPILPTRAGNRLRRRAILDHGRGRVPPWQCNSTDSAVWQRTTTSSPGSAPNRPMVNRASGSALQRPAISGVEMGGHDFHRPRSFDQQAGHRPASRRGQGNDSWKRRHLGHGRSATRSSRNGIRISTLSPRDRIANPHPPCLPLCLRTVRLSPMGYLIGTDEAGYGPNLGPLVISATLWEVPEGVGSEDLYRRLEAVITRLAGGLQRLNPRGHGRFQEAVSVGQGVAAAGTRPVGGLRALGPVASHLRAKFGKFWPAGAAAVCRDEFGYSPGRRPCRWMPMRPNSNLSARGWRRRFPQPECGCWRVRSRAIFPRQFNELVAEQGSKGACSRGRPRLGRHAGRVVAPWANRRAVRQAWRARSLRAAIGGILSRPAHRDIWPVGEQSVYRFGPQERRIEFRFQARAEAHLPAALASMASKYLRELAMRAWNEFWCGRLPGLAPTAGYPQDAVRFKAQIATVQCELGIEDHLFGG